MKENFDVVISEQYYLKESVQKTYLCQKGGEVGISPQPKLQICLKNIRIHKQQQGQVSHIFEPTPKYKGNP